MLDTWVKDPRRRVLEKNWNTQNNQKEKVEKSVVATLLAVCSDTAANTWREKKSTFMPFWVEKEYKRLFIFIILCTYKNNQQNKLQAWPEPKIPKGYKCNSSNKQLWMKK